MSDQEVIYDPDYNGVHDSDLPFGLGPVVNKVLDAIADGELSDQALFTLYRMALKEAQERELVR